MSEDSFIDEESHYTSAFSYDESIREFNQCRYNGSSYSFYHIWNHLLHLICRCARAPKESKGVPSRA